MQFSWKVKGSLKSKPSLGAGAYHAAFAARHLEKNCDEAGRASIEQSMM